MDVAYRVSGVGSAEATFQSGADFLQNPANYESAAALTSLTGNSFPSMETADPVSLRKAEPRARRWDGRIAVPPIWRIAEPRLLAMRLSPNFVQVRRYFEEALGESPVQEFRGRLCFERRQRFRWGVSWRRCILEAPAGGVRIQWLANDDFGMSELREFFEAPFFSEAETEQFYRWLSRWGWHEATFRKGVVWMGVLPGDGLVFVEIFWREVDSETMGR